MSAAEASVAVDRSSCPSWCRSNDYDHAGEDVAYHESQPQLVIAGLDLKSYAPVSTQVDGQVDERVVVLAWHLPEIVGMSPDDARGLAARLIELADLADGCTQAT